MRRTKFALSLIWTCLVACGQDPNATSVPAAVAFRISGLPAPVLVGEPVAFLVTAEDASGQTVTGYTGKVHFTSDDPLAALPPDYQFQRADTGVRGFFVTFRTTGLRTIVATDVGTSMTGTRSANVMGTSPMVKPSRQRRWVISI